MRTTRTLIGMPVVVNGRRSGRIIQAELSEDLSRLAALWVDAGLRGTRRIPSEHLAMLGQVAVMADDLGHRGHCKSGPLFRRAVGTDGRRLGAVTGAEIDELSFCVESLELSGGFWDDLFTGRRRIHSFTLSRNNGDVIIDLAGTEKEDANHEKRYDEGIDYRSADRRHRSSNVRNQELANGQENESAGTKNRTMDFR